MTDARRTVLVIDDEQAVREVLKRFLSRAGYDVQVAADGKQALEMVHQHAPPDVIVLDLMMPVMSGFEVLSALRLVPAWAAIPVVILSGNTDYSAQHLHADAVLEKPFDSTTVKAAVDKALASRKPA